METNTFTVAKKQGCPEYHLCKKSKSNIFLRSMIRISPPKGETQKEFILPELKKFESTIL